MSLMHILDRNEIWLSKIKETQKLICSLFDQLGIQIKKQKRDSMKLSLILDTKKKLVKGY